MKCRVLRPFPMGNGEIAAIGQLVDTTSWRNREQLIAQRYIQPARLSSGFEKRSSETSEKPYHPPAKAVPTKKIKRRRVLAEV